MQKISWHEKYEDYLILAVGLILAFLLRYSLREFESGDFRNFLEPWYDFINRNGKFAALQHNFSNYTPLYLYLLVTASYILAGLSKVFAIKLISILFDFLCAFFVYKIVRLRYPTGAMSILAAFIVLFAPTVVLNGAFWGQADVIYTTGLVACLYFLLVKREGLAFVAFGLAVAFKLQGLFLAPLMLVLFLKKEVSWKSFFLIPLVYVVTILPAWLSGRPLDELLLIYVSQVDFYRSLAKNAPNLYQWLPNDLYDIFYPAGVIWTVALIFFLAVLVRKSQAKLTQELVVLLATLSVLGMPYFLPKMHDRYFFAADVISIILAFYYPRYFYVPVAIGLVSLFSYFPFLFGTELISLSYLAIVLAAIIVILSRHLILGLYGENVQV
jgi:Gpi18-like mannosyltransferase